MRSLLSRPRIATILCGLVLSAAMAHGADLAAMGKTNETPVAAAIGLRGHVKQCVEENTYVLHDAAEQTVTSAWTFAADGRVLQVKIESSASQSVVNYIYDALGRLTKVSSGEGEENASIYAYDDKGRLTSISGAGVSNATFEYNNNGRKRRIQHWPVIQREPNVGVGAVPWENSDIAIPPPSGGTITTVYDEDDRPAEAEVRDDAGQVTMRIIRKYDEHGWILGDKLVTEKLDWLIPPEATTEMNEAQRKALATFAAMAFGQEESAYKYDSHGLQIEKRIKGGVRGDEVTTRRYNDQGDLTEEDIVSVPSPATSREYQVDDAGNLIPGKTIKGPEPSRTLHHYSYEYDAQGNWTARTMSVRTEPETEFKVVTKMRRTVTYY